MSESVLIERRDPGADEDLRGTAVSDVPIVHDAADVPAVGSVIDERYEITGLLGQGGMGHVLAARHVVLGHRLAIKVLRREMTRDAEIVERFRREARAASAIGHAGIVAVKDFGTLPSGASYYVMEHVDGQNLGDALAADRRFAVDRAVDVVRQIADALGAAHAAGIVHRDVKPENVLLTSFHGRPDHVKILDFGIAKLDFASRLSGAHRILGTPAYMSPEQTRGQALDQRTDVYALGILFFELLTGDVPFDDARPLEVLRMQIQKAPPSIASLRPDVPAVVADAITRCLAKEPAARPQSMHELVELLAPVTPSRAIAFASTPAPPPPATKPRVPLELGATLLALPQAPRAPSRPTPAAPPAMPTPSASRTRGWAIAAGAVLAVAGIVTLATAGGILLREHEDAAPAALVVTPAPVPVLAAAPPSVGTPPPSTALVEIPTLVDAMPPAAATPPVPAPAPLVTHHAHRPVLGAPEPPSAPASPPTPAPASSTERPSHVLDPWDDP